MADSITKKELEDILDKKFAQYQGAILEAVNYKFQTVENEVSELRSEIRRLTVALDNFLKKLTDSQEEFTILKAEVDQIKDFIKQKFNFEIAVQR